jgi:hypothetical protein
VEEDIDQALSQRPGLQKDVLSIHVSAAELMPSGDVAGLGRRIKRENGKTYRLQCGRPLVSSILCGTFTWTTSILWDIGIVGLFAVSHGCWMLLLMMKRWWWRRTVVELSDEMVVPLTTSVSLSSGESGTRSGGWIAVIVEEDGDDDAVVEVIERGSERVKAKRDKVRWSQKKTLFRFLLGHVVSSVTVQLQVVAEWYLYIVVLSISILCIL